MGSGGRSCNALPARNDPEDGVKFQRVQKDENARNRIGAGRLFAIAGLFRVPISAFFDGAGHLAADCEGQSLAAVLSEPCALRLMQAFCGLGISVSRESLIDPVEAMANVKTDRTNISDMLHSPASSAARPR